jgi:hypothetical protein
VFGYTSEVVFNDFIQFADRYRPDLDLRILNRDWTVEKKDEARHNIGAQRAGVRPWKKSDAIRAFALEPWPHTMRRNIRYYRHQPILKGVLLCGSDNGASVGFVGFVHWQNTQPGGGSQFKSESLTVVHVTSETEEGRLLLGALESQFDYEWLQARTAETIMQAERKGGSS